jgi:hypothetical protein
MKIQLIQQLSELDGGDFLEIFPGPYKGRAWNEQSVYVEDEAFSLLTPIVLRHAPEFDNCGNTPISKESWIAIIKDLEALKRDLASANSVDALNLQFRNATISSDFGSGFEENKRKLTVLIDDLSGWLNRELEKQTIISILGI